MTDAVDALDSARKCGETMPCMLYCIGMFVSSDRKNVIYRCYAKSMIVIIKLIENSRAGRIVKLSMHFLSGFESLQKDAPCECVNFVIFIFHDFKLFMSMSRVD